MIKSYRVLRYLTSFEERFEYLKIGGVVGRSTFGFERYLNQMLYTSREWKTLTRPEIVLRDNGCDLGIKGREIYDRIVVHHMNPITVEDIERSSDAIFDPDNLICMTHNTHMAIHYGDASRLEQLPIERRKGDTTLWKVY